LFARHHILAARTFHILFRHGGSFGGRGALRRGEAVPSGVQALEKASFIEAGTAAAPELAPERLAGLGRR
jgi:hypothetical protein